MTIRLAVFDCDGTLVDSQANIVRAMADCFARARLDPPCPTATRRIVGLSLVEAMQALLPEAEADLHHALAQDYKTAFQRLRANGLVEEPLYPGVREGLAAIEARGWLLGVATGKSDRGLALCLAHHGLAPHFVTLQTADRHPSKPHPSMLLTAIRDTGAEARDTLMIGDTSFDMAMGAAAGARPVGVDWGYHAADELRAAGADKIVNRFEDLVEMMEDMPA